ncbi:uncharacterized protein LOC108908143 [Anoplophora glabripennis]|uniref:uncharacterized protein LOC108908143 n=1 Tax=Anoplophora glabripennis TaxID=217634 RepID=UPI000C77CEAA|nr:uncharacterized protein LOC108908143 [Anoplophora glabripennis]
MVDGSEQIGGPNKIVEVNEDKIKVGKRKYNRDDNSKETLLQVIKNWVLPGTTIISDCWKSYDCLADEGFQHETVNHSKNFVDLDTGVHTRNTDKLWRDMKSSIPRFSRRENNFDGYLAECQFRMKYSNHTDRFHHFFKSMAHLQPPAELDSGESSDGSD